MLSVLAPRLRVRVVQGGGARCFSAMMAETGSAGRWRMAIGGGGLALCAGAASVGFSNSKVARADGMALPFSECHKPFSFDTDKYDQTTFQGRLFGMYEKIDPRTLLIGDEELKRSRELLDQFKKAGKVPSGVTDAQLWEARRVVESIIHPVTDEPIPSFGRMSAFVPMNVPLCAFMLMAATPMQTVAAQWLNQTYNVVNNFVNRSGATVDWAPLLQAYALATTSAVSIAIGAGKLIQAVPVLKVMGPFVPYLAVISAGSSNVGFTRMEEWNGKGVTIFDAEGKELGMSPKAGQQAVLQTVLTRSCFLPIFPMVVPPLIMSALPTIGFAPVAIAVECVVIAGAIGCMLPVALSILPQKMEVSVASLEPQFQNLKDAKGNPVTTVFANKGL